VLAATNTAWSWRRRQVSLGVAGLGVEVSHYSTMYVFVGTLGIALVCAYAIRLFLGGESEADADLAGPNLRRRRRRRASRLRNAVTIGLVTVFIGIIFAWGTLVTNTTGQVLTDGSGAISSGAISLNLFGSTVITPTEAIAQL